MAYSYIPTPDFEKSFKKLYKKYKSLINDYQKFTEEFEANPEMGVDLGGGYRKIRMKIESKGKGKAGGARIILYDYFIKCNDNKVVLVDIYDKSEISILKEQQYTESFRKFIKKTLKDKSK